MRANEAITYSNVTFDVWWNKSNTLAKEDIDLNMILETTTKPMTIVAVAAPHMGFKPGTTYSRYQLQTMMKKVALIFLVADRRRSTVIMPGLFGGGAYRGNRPLTYVLHMVLHRPSAFKKIVNRATEKVLQFHYPMQRVTQASSNDTLIVDKGNELLHAVRESKPKPANMQDLFHCLMKMRLRTSQHDADLIAVYKPVDYSRDGDVNDEAPTTKSSTTRPKTEMSEARKRQCSCSGRRHGIVPRAAAWRTREGIRVDGHMVATKRQGRRPKWRCYRGRGYVSCVDRQRCSSSK